MMPDVLIVGSGASAVHAAFPLVVAGLSVKMVDMGYTDAVYPPLIPNASFSEIRQTDPRQHRYFLGDRFEGIPLGTLRTGPQLTPPRQYICKNTQTWTPVQSQTFSAVASLAQGGLACGWGAGAMAFNQHDMKDFPISCDTLATHYETIAERIGVSGEADDLLPFDGRLQAMLPPLKIDKNAKTVLNAYQNRKTAFNAAGFYMGKPRLAALSQAYKGRGPERYGDMSFWADTDQSVWRPRYTLQELQSFPHFSYEPYILVDSFQDDFRGCVTLIGKNTETGQGVSYSAKRLILAAGILGTTRLVLKSFHQYDRPLPIVCTPYTYYALLNLSMLGQSPSEANHSLAQLCVVYAPTGKPFVHGRLHSYRSLLNFRIIKDFPLPFREGMRVAKMLIPNLVLLALDHEDRPTPDKYCILRNRSDGPDTLDISFSVSKAVTQERRQHEKAILCHFRRLGCFALKRVWPGHGASIHYGGSLPMSREEREFTVDIQGRLRGTQSVYIADSSVFPYLPAKGLTFTMMANANRIGEAVCKTF